MNEQDTNLIGVMPAFNEEGCIETVVTKTLNLLSNFPKASLLVINDGSKDNTGSILDELKRQNSRLRVLHQPNAGHGAAILKGYEEALQAGAEWIFQLDADDQCEISDFWMLWENRRLCPFILGFRKQRNDPLFRRWTSFLARCVIFVFFGTWIRDPNVPFRLMKSEFLKKLMTCLGGKEFAPNIALSILAKKNKADLKSVPVRHRARSTGAPSLKLKSWMGISLRCVTDIIKLRLRRWN